ncbi:ORF1 in transposon ISC1229 [Saccharolobus solfataricus]|uniref:ORF1 in transposon ISC1229 n=1 Tax=Saccharolobus solfataricus TaxID=2287 RepID=A0A157T196_SACSO|nr:ORF1 in transposon ISC1229 [Saccharolobus solfataricus]
MVTSKGRVRKFTNNEKGYEEILTMKPNIIVIEPTGVYSTRPCQYFKERGVKVLLVSLVMERKGRKGKENRFLRRRKT